MNLRLTPTDTFFFRNHRDLETGKGSFLKGIFPPRLSTSYGALRSAYIYAHSDFEEFKKEKNLEVKKWMGTSANNGKFAIKSVFIYDGEEAILPLPLDHQVIEHNGIEKALRVQLKADDTPSSNGQKYQLFGAVEEKSNSASDAYLKATDWKEALLHASEVKISRLSKWIVNEPKTGIAIQRDTRITSDKMIYNMAFQRFKQGYEEAGFIIETKNSPDFKNVKTAKFGGNGRPWIVSTTSEQAISFSSKEIEAISKEIATTGIARLILLTPAIWTYGNRPSNYDEKTNTLTFDDLTVEMLAVATQRPLVVGGWDIVGKRPKKRQHAVAAGTVVYVKVNSENTEKFVNKILNYAWTDQLAHEGYGYVVCGPATIN